MKTLVTPSSWIKASEDAVISPPNLQPPPFGRRHRVLVQTNLAEAILRRGVREDHLVAGLKSLDDLHRADRHPAQLHRHPDGGLAVLVQPEDLDLAVRLPVAGAADEEHVVEVLDLDRAVHREVRTGALGEGPL